MCKPKSVIILAFAGSFLLATGACATSSKKTLRILQTTDVHGFFSDPGAHQDGTPRPGGMRALAAIVDAARSKPDAAVMLVDSGDMWSGTLLSDRTEGAAGVRLFNALKYDAVALGNHEFDYGPPGHERAGEGRAAFGALVQRIEEAAFPVLACNLRDRQTKQRPSWMNLRASVVVHRGGWKIGVVGAITEETPSITFPYVGRQLIFDDPIPAIADEARRLKVIDKVDMVIVVAHIGGQCRRFKDPKDLGSCVSESPAFKIAREVPKGLIQAIFGGHTHRRVAHWVNGVAVIQAGQHARALGVLDVRPNDEGQPVLAIGAHVPIVADDTAKASKTTGFVYRILAPMEVDVAKIRGEKLGARVVDTMTRSRLVQSPMGSFVCDTLKALHPDRDLCIVNSGGLRRAFPKGELTYGRLYDALPFGNAVAYLDVDGKTLLELVRLGTSGAHGVIQVAGMSVTYDQSKDHCPTVDRSGDGKIDANDRDRVVVVTVAGAPVDPAKTYKVVTSSFLASGGDDWGQALERGGAEVQIFHTQPPVREQVGGALRRLRPVLNSPDNPAMKRVRVKLVGKVPRQRCR